MNESDSPARFPTTCWSRVAHAVNPAAPEARAALAELCGAYWYPIYALIRRQRHDSDRALDLTQDFFARLLEKDILAAADPARGRLRTFLRAVCMAYLANQDDRENAEKRGGGRTVLSIDTPEAEARYSRELAHDLTPERLFERNWTLTLLAIVLDRLRRDYQDAGQSSVFESLRVILTDGPRSVPYAEIAARLGVTEGAVAVAVHRLRRRYGELLREEIEATVDDPAEVDDEVRALFTSLRPC